MRKKDFVKMSESGRASLIDLAFGAAKTIHPNDPNASRATAQIHASHAPPDEQWLIIKILARLFGQ